MTKVITFVLFAILVVLFWVNRSHPKIQEALIVAIAGLTAAVLGVIFFSQDVGNIEKEISQVYFKSNKENKIMFFNAPVLLHYHLQQNVIYGNFTKRNPKQAETIFSNMPANANYLTELQVATLLNHLFQFYPFDWYIKREAKSFPGFNTIRGQRLDPNNKDIVSFSKNELQKVFEKNIFYPDIITELKLSLPKGTKVKYIHYDDKSRYCQIEFYKTLYFNISIRIYYSSYVVGLGNVAYHVGIAKPQKDFTKPADDIKDYGTIVLTMDCKASFNKFRSGDPAMLRYKEWARNLFNDLYNTFDWSVCDNGIRDYSEILAHQKIINN